MVSKSETVGNAITDEKNNYLNPLMTRQREGVARMRTALLASTDDNTVTMRQAIQNITAMRIYHQLSRIIKYTELMDSLEDKLYESISDTIVTSNSSDPTTWLALLNIQERLQKSMIESHKMLQPYLDVGEFSVVDLVDASVTDEAVDEKGLAISSQSRDNIRIKAQAILSQIEVLGDNE
jgi:hypothetical protein